MNRPLSVGKLEGQQLGDLYKKQDSNVFLELAQSAIS